MRALHRPRLLAAIPIAALFLSTPIHAQAASDSSTAVTRSRILRKLDSGGINAALAEFRTIHDANPEAAPESILNDLGYSLLAQSKIVEAIRAFRENIAAYPTSPNVYSSIGDAYLAGGHRTAARDAYLRAVELDSTKTRARTLADSLNARLRH